MGIEPTALAWEARVLPLYDTRSGRLYTRIHPQNEARIALWCSAGQRGLLSCASYGHGVQAGVDGEAFAGGAVLQEAQQGVLGLQPCTLVFHVDEVAGVADGGEVAVVDVLGHQAGVGG